ncbi:uncharacterized protein Z518_09202 [Rhinocladiella mackenziei CBS 650.93]|uniref:SHSP domain-containing protein n=1 Tax=Rhinocladiella mackenziei CBS 650.93 TaxID=1442369 RepID=A0A0D2IE07_9EURO|nr:uncharacterized protein Z518_09202 [Rhinocladiella mackenziei CBS 650.93]KIX01476.1 hypothetical protein Z518_09202 [Rhinocladiella mackenziei CBS 650.93]
MATLECLRHPHHISLVDTHSLRAKFNHAGDAYYNIDGMPSHHGVMAPKFDVYEMPSEEWLIVGDVPGLTTEGAEIEWLEESTVFIRGKLNSSTMTTLTETEGLGLINPAILKPLHKERHEGSFERSVTLPGKADIKGAKVMVKNGVIFVRIPKKVETTATE